MTPERFRDLALALPEVEEREHQGHPDFRVGGKVFATLGPEGSWGMVKVPSDLQTRLAREAPDTYEPMNGAWGKQGCTRVLLKKARVAALREALLAAWKKSAPKKILKAYEDEHS